MKTYTLAKVSTVHEGETYYTGETCRHNHRSLDAAARCKDIDCHGVTHILDQDGNYVANRAELVYTMELRHCSAAKASQLNEEEDRR